MPDDGNGSSTRRLQWVPGRASGASAAAGIRASRSTANRLRARSHRRRLRQGRREVRGHPSTGRSRRSRLAEGSDIAALALAALSPAYRAPWRASLQASPFNQAGRILFRVDVRQNPRRPSARSRSSRRSEGGRPRPDRECPCSTPPDRREPPCRTIEEAPTRRVFQSAPGGSKEGNQAAPPPSPAARGTRPPTDNAVRAMVLGTT